MMLTGWYNIVWFTVSPYKTVVFSLKNIFIAGEHCDERTKSWTQQAFDAPVLDNWWQTGKKLVVKITRDVYDFQFKGS